jgi:inhibitor of KinA
MHNQGFPYRIFPLGDSAITIDFGNCIDEEINKEVIARFNQLRQKPLPGMIETVPAYSSLTVYYDVFTLKKKMAAGQSVYEWVKQQLEEILLQPVQPDKIKERLIKIPVCYEDEFASDIHRLAKEKNISIEEVIHIHTAKQYKVYMLGFLPGFPYMGELVENIAMSRKSQPVNVAAGSVAIAGKQTGIYPFASPGGWQIIGRTPLKLFKALPNPDTSGQALSEGEALDSESFNPDANDPTLLKAGDRVQFYSITKNEFEEIKATESLKH